MDPKILALFLGMGLVTYLPRMLPLVFLSRRPIPDLVLRWLRYVPPAVLAALLVPELLLQGGEWHFSFGNAYLVAALPTFLVALWFRHMVLTVAAGMVLVVILRGLL